MTSTLTPAAYIVLGLLEQMGEGSPYQLKQAVSMSVGNFWSIPHSQVYRTAENLAGERYLSMRAETTTGGRPRKVYAVTAKGKRALAKWRRELPTVLPELRDPGLLKLFFGADPAALARPRLDAHRRQLEAYEARRALDTGDPPRGPWLTLDAGIAHEREWVRFWEDLAE